MVIFLKSICDEPLTSVLLSKFEDDWKTFSIVVAKDDETLSKDDVKANPFSIEAVYCCFELLIIPSGIFVKFTFLSAPLPLDTIISILWSKEDDASIYEAESTNPALCL